MDRAIAFFAFVALSSWFATPSKVEGQAMLGAKAGLSLATFGGDHPAEFDHRAAVNAGAFLDLPLSGRVGLRVGAEYFGKGAETTFSGGGGNPYVGTVEYRFGYVEVPAILKLGVLQGRRASANLLIGPALSFKVSCEMEMATPEWKEAFKCKEAGFDVRAVDLGARTGIDVEAQVSEGLRVVGESHYSFGLRTVGTSGDGVKNRGFAMSLGLAFPIR